MWKKEVVACFKQLCQHLFQGVDTNRKFDDPNPKSSSKFSQHEYRVLIILVSAVNTVSLNELRLGQSSRYVGICTQLLD
jgi:hypothetical protein